MTDPDTPAGTPGPPPGYEQAWLAGYMYRLRTEMQMREWHAARAAPRLVVSIREFPARPEQ